MRGVETRIQEIRHRIFREAARMAYHTEWPIDKRIEELPYKIIPGEVGNFRNDVFLERAIVGERLRLAMGLPYRGAGDPAPVSDGIEAAGNVLYAAADQCDQICLQCVCRKKGHGDRRLPGLPGPPLCGGLPQGCGEPGPDQREIQDRSGEVH